MSRLSYLVDTDWIIDQLNEIRPVKERLDQARRDGLAISIISVAELWEGVLFSREPRRGQQKLEEFLQGVSVLGITPGTCKKFAELRGTLRRQGKLIPDFDLLIATTALEHNLTLLSNNRRHFVEIPNLRLESL